MVYVCKSVIFGLFSCWTMPDFLFPVKVLYKTSRTTLEYIHHVESLPVRCQSRGSSKCPFAHH
ncbi:hypothetical protein PAXRUDRAFT_320512 [Paxillus rubicundulus Ve08.2h10]|uniref:Uncharacterized protein n=1 Tax=Paxillus rubicundulus Ve08.2h10 TaxID=930991 RepID=A0A0D0DS98_9AGAM|nr:hypothetical protein PAXRUDRAFT_320512 [Paxillus rubicundulus Ve08.2h10]